MPYVSPKDLSVSSLAPSPRSSQNASPVQNIMTEPVDSLASALAATQLAEPFDSPPPLSECATTSSNSVQTLQSDASDDAEPAIASPSQPPNDTSPEAPAAEQKSTIEEELQVQQEEPTTPPAPEEVSPVQSPPPSGTVLDAIPTLPDMDLSKLQTYSRAIHAFTLKLYVRAEQDSLSKGHALPPHTPRIAV